MGGESDQVEFTRNFFGPPVHHIRKQSDMQMAPSSSTESPTAETKLKEIFIISNQVKEGLGAELIPFHTDLSYRTSPLSYSILHAIEIPPTGGDTCWSTALTPYSSR